MAHAPVYLRTAQLNDERRVDDEGSVTSEPKRRSKSPARLEDTLEAIVENEDRAWARVDDDEKRKSPRKSRRRYRFWPRRRRRRTTTAKREACAIWGNTCYMNATLQALAAAPPLRTPRSGEYAFDLNTESKYSPKGVLAAAFGDLVVRALQEKKGGAFRPNRFRRVVGRYDATFAGYRQQDAFEFLAKLVEGLGDDLVDEGVSRSPITRTRNSSIGVRHRCRDFIRFSTITT